MKSACKAVVDMRQFSLVLLFAFLLKIGTCFQQSEVLSYTNRWVVRAASEGEVKDVCSKHNFVYIGEIFEDYYSIQHDDVPMGMRTSTVAMQDLLEADERILEVSQLLHRPRELREMGQGTNTIEENNSDEMKLLYTDPKHSLQAWYMYKKVDDTGLPGLNIDVAWREGLTGRGVVVTVVDEGLFIDNIDIVQNYNAEASFSFTFNHSNPTPNSRSSHGTRCAGVIAAQANNSFCGVGVAHNAGIAGIAMPFDNSIGDDIEAKALTYALDKVDIYSNSWGPTSQTNTLYGDAGPLMKRALELGVHTGRRGKGAIYVWATGNGGGFGNSCAYDRYSNLRYSIPVAALRSDGRRLNYGESCSAIMISAYSRNSKSDPPIVTTDGFDGDCVTGFHKSSVATALVSGAVALALEANPRMTWRDVQHALVQSSNSSVTLEPSDWIINSAGLKVSPTFGFGILDVAKLVDMSRRWLTVPQSVACVKSGHDPLQLPHQLDLMITDCPIVYLEHVEVSFYYNYTARGHIGVTLNSPGGTHSTLLPGRYRDMANKTLNWTVVSVHFWGEAVSNPSTPWVLNFTKRYPQYNMSGELLEWKMTFHGFKVETPFVAPKCVVTEACPSGDCENEVATFDKVWLLWCIAFAIGYLTAMLCCCICMRYGALMCKKYCHIGRKRRRPIRRTVSDDWHSETDEEGPVRSPSVAGSHMASSAQYSHGSSWTPKGFSDAIQNVVKPFLFEFFCCCLRRNKNTAMPNTNQILMSDGTMVTIETGETTGNRSADVPGYEAPVPAVCSQSFNEPTQVYNIKKCKVEVIGNPSALQVFNLNRSVVSFASQEVTTEEPKSIVEMCDDCIVVNGQRQISFTRALSVCKSRVSYSEPTDACNQAVNILQSTVYITINSDHYTADRSQVVNIYDSDVCIEIRASCTGVPATTRTVNISDSKLNVLVPMPCDMTQSIISNASSTVVVPAPVKKVNNVGPSTAPSISPPRESVEYATVRKEPQTGQTIIGTGYNTMNKNGGYTALNRVPVEGERDELDYCMPITSGAQGNQTLATVHNPGEVPLAHISPNDEYTKPAFQAYQRRPNSVTEQHKQPKRVSVPDVPQQYVNQNPEVTDVKEPWTLEGPEVQPNRTPIYTVPQLPVQGQGSNTTGRPASASVDGYNPYSQLIGPVAVPTYTVPKRGEAERPRSQSDFNTTNSRIYTGLTRTSPPQGVPSSARPPQVQLPENPGPAPQVSPPHLETYSIPSEIRTPNITQSKPADPVSSGSLYTVPQLPSSFRPIDNPQQATKSTQVPKQTQLPKRDPFSMKVHTEIDPISKEPLYAVPNTLQKKSIVDEIPPFKPKPISPTVPPPLDVVPELPKKSSESSAPVSNGVSPTSPFPAEVFTDKHMQVPPPRPPRIGSSTSSESDSADPKKSAKNVPTLQPRNRPLSVEIRCNNPKKKKNPRPVSLPDDDSVNDYEIPERPCTPDEQISIVGTAPRMPETVPQTVPQTVTTQDRYTTNMDSNGNTDNGSANNNMHNQAQRVEVAS